MADRSHSRMRYENIAGALLFGAGVLAFLGRITAETLYPGYSTSQNMISDLGETEPPNSIFRTILEPASSIFSTSMAVTGVLIRICLLHQPRIPEASSHCSHCLIRNRDPGSWDLQLEIFNGSYGAIHGIFALMAFVMGGTSAIASSGIERSPPN